MTTTSAITISCLQTFVTSGNSTYPIFVGFASAQDIRRIAEAPSFRTSTPHDTIAKNTLTPPIRDWQRPIDQARVNEISNLFNTPGEFMPNPVLLCQNVNLSQSPITIQQQLSNPNGMPTGIWNVVVPILSDGFPLWIIDGQHRIAGLAQSQQAANPIPVVLLLNQESAVYTGPTVAKLFAQVTTSATKLDPLHNEWLTFAFALGNYSQSNSVDRNAMQCVAMLCGNPQFNNSVANPFFNQIKFNPELSIRSGGFEYTCIELKDIIHKGYYKLASFNRSHLTPTDLSKQIALSYTALTQVVQAPQDESVFFGSSNHGQRIMQDAYLKGILTYLLNYPAPTNSQDWIDILHTLQFHRSNWNFSQWIRSLSGDNNSASRKIAEQVFVTAFRNKSLPTQQGNLADYLRGNAAFVELTCSHLTKSGKASRANTMSIQLTTGSILSETIAGREHIKIAKISDNIGSLKIVDKKSPPGKPVYYKTVIKLNQNIHNNPLSLLLQMEHYGGLASSAELEITW